MRTHRELKYLRTPKKKSPVPGYEKKIMEAFTKTQLTVIRGLIANNLNVSNEEMERLTTMLEKKKQEV